MWLLPASPPPRSQVRPEPGRAGGREEAPAPRATNTGKGVLPAEGPGAPRTRRGAAGPGESQVRAPGKVEGSPRPPAAPTRLGPSASQNPEQAARFRSGGGSAARPLAELPPPPAAQEVVYHRITNDSLHEKEKKSVIGPLFASSVID